MVFRTVRLLAAFAGSLLFVAGWASGASARSSARSVPRWASHGFIVFKYLDSLAQIRPGSESGGILVGGPAEHTLGPHTPWDPALSPNGRFLAFRGYYKPFAEGSYALYILHLRTGKFRRATQSIAGDPSWSPDGKWIAFDTSGGGEVWKVRASGGKPVRLTQRGPNAVGDATPTWSPNGRQIAFVRWVHQRGQIWVMRSNGHDAHPIHSDNHFSDSSPAWSHDGTRIAFVIRHRNHATLEVMNANGRHRRDLPSPRPNAWNPVWLPYDTGIGFLGGDASHGSGNLFVMRPDGRDVYQLTHWHGPARTEQFAWTGARLLSGRC